MSQQLTIQSLVTSSEPYVGITNQGQTYVPVQLNQDNNTWTVSDGSQFSIGGFTYTGVDSDNVTVIASDESTYNVQWQTIVSDCGSNQYTISDINSGLVWTVFDTDSDTTGIIVQPPTSEQCDNTQLFLVTELTGS